MEDAQKKYLEKDIVITYEYMAPDAASYEDQTRRLLQAQEGNYDVIGVDVADEEKISPVLDEMVAAGSKVFRSMANTDSLTGVRNKHAYMEAEAGINSRIQEGAIDKLALVVCDINGLKFVNDTMGHAAGDQLIKGASALICDIFNHGSVFRTGGDEFVVLLQGKGYDTRDEVIAAFNGKAEENIRKNEVVVSIGYSTLRPEDEQLHDVFERADHMMYLRKKELKSMGAKTREFDEARS